MRAATSCIYKNKEITVFEALRLREKSKSKLVFKCIHCDELVKPHNSGSNCVAHFEHYKKNFECPYSAGKKIESEFYDIAHPKAIEGYQFDRKILAKGRCKDLAEKRKKMDDYTCQACGFRLNLHGKFIIECHHLNPIRYGERNTELKDLVSLCPTCHRISHTRDNPLPPSEIAEHLKPK